MRHANVCGLSQHQNLKKLKSTIKNSIWFFRSFRKLSEIGMFIDSMILFKGQGMVNLKFWKFKQEFFEIYEQILKIPKNSFKCFHPLIFCSKTSWWITYRLQHDWLYIIHFFRQWNSICFRSSIRGVKWIHCKQKLIQVLKNLIK